LEGIDDFVIELKPASDRDVFWNFARAETDSVRFSKYYEPGLSARVLDLLRVDDRAAMSESEWKDLSRVVRQVRGGVLELPLRLGAVWHFGKLPVAALPEVRVMNLPQFVAVAPTRTLREFVKALDRGVRLPGDEPFGENYRRLLQQFDLSKMRGVPVVVSPSITGPYELIEGVTRTSIILSRSMVSESVLSGVPALLGVSPGLADYPGW
jgi:hypothetical protein